MLDYERILNELTLTTELSGSFKCLLKSPGSGAFTLVQVVVAGTVTFCGRCTYAMTTSSHMTPDVDYVFTPRIVLRPRLRALNNVSSKEITTSLMTATMNNVMFISQLEYSIRIRKGEKLRLAQELVFEHTAHRTKEVTDWADTIHPISET